MLRGLDISSYQGPEDLARMRARLGLSFVGIRAIRSTGTVDTRFAQNWAAARAAGLVRIAYCWQQAGQEDPASYARRCLTTARPSGSDLLCLDLEGSAATATATAAWCCAWADAVTALTEGAIAPGLYCGGYMDLRAYRPLRDHFGWWWYPRYPNAYAGKATWPATFNPALPDPNVWGAPPAFWQFSQTFPAEPNDPHDANVFNGTLTDLRTLNGPPPEADMPLTEADLDGIWRYDISGVGSDTTRQDAARWLATTQHDVTVALARIGDLGEKLDALAVKVAALAGTGLPAADVEAALRRVLGSLDQPPPA